MVRSKSIGEKIFHGFNITLMVLLILVSLYPLYYAVINSMNTGYAIQRGFSLFLPADFTMESWRTVLSDPSMLGALGLTALRTAIVTVASTVVTTMFAYAYSRPYLRGKRFYSGLGVVSMYFSGGVIPFFLLISTLGLYNNFWVYIIPSLFGGYYNVIIYNTNFKALPDALFESAKVDGAKEFTIYWKIVMPLSKPVLAALCVFTAVGVWNDYSTTLYYTQSPQLKTLQYCILELVQSYNAADQLTSSAMSASASISELFSQNNNAVVNAKTIELAAMVLSAIPMIIMYPFAQKYFVQGVMLGSVKG